MDLDVQTDATLEAMAETELAGSTTIAGVIAALVPSSRGNSSGGAVGGAGSPQHAAQPPALKGYPKEITQQPVEDKFLCGYCENILREPLQSECGHRFCAGCRVAMTSLNDMVECKACVEEGVTDDERFLNLDEMFEDKAAKREMRKIRCKCVNPGCSWKGIFHDYITEHEMNCDKKKIECPLCGSLMSQNKLDKHMKTECSKREVTCQYCGHKMIQEEEATHKKICVQYPIKCPRCSASVPRNEFDMHETRDCIHREMVCPVPDCHQKMSREQFPHHLNESPKMIEKHLLYLFDNAEKLEQKVNDLTVHGVPQAPAQQEMAAAAGGAGAVEVHQQVNNGASSAAAPEPRETLKLHEDLMSVLHGEILRCIRQVEALSTSRVKDTRELQRKLQQIETRFRDSQPSVQRLNSAVETGTLVESADGVATWSIPQFSQLRRAAVNNAQLYVDSPPFMTGSLGYKLRIRLYPDGEAGSKGNGLAVFLHVLPGPCDDLLPWPFQADIHFVLIDHRDFKHHKTASIRTPDSGSGCRRPVSAEQPIGMGVNSIIRLQEMGNDIGRYNEKDILYLRAIVKLKGISVENRLKDLDPSSGAASGGARSYLAEAQQATT